MINILGLVGGVVVQFKNDRRVTMVPIMVFKMHANAAIGRQILARKGVAGVWHLINTQKPIGVIGYPSRIDAHMIGNHVAGEANTALGGTVTQIGTSLWPTQIIGNAIIV